MLDNKVAASIDKGVRLATGEHKRESPLSNQIKRSPSYNDTKHKPWYSTAAVTITHYSVLFILGLLVWGMLWFTWGDSWWWDGPWFRLAAVVITAWASGLVLQSVTSLPPLLAALVTGILARHFEYIDMREHTGIDVLLRKVYPVIILGKGSLTWDTNYMKNNWKQIAALGVLPWSAEVVTLSTCTHFFLGHPWIWGLILGTFYASVTCPVVMPNVILAGCSPRRTRVWPQLVCTAGGIDTALSVGVSGVLVSYLFSNPNESDTYRYIRAFTALFAGVALGIVWGRLAGLIPHSGDLYVVELRVLFVVIGGLFMNVATLYIGWGGVAGVAVLACNATAARYWEKSGWKLNNNPAATAYRVMWSACEPAVFAFTGTYFVFKSTTYETLMYGFGIMLISMSLRLFVAALTCWHLSLKEKLYICCVWSTKSIVEAVLAPGALIILITHGGTQREMQYAEDFVILIVQEILIATPLAFLLTKYLGPVLLKDKPLSENESSS